MRWLNVRRHDSTIPTYAGYSAPVHHPPIWRLVSLLEVLERSTDRSVMKPDFNPRLTPIRSLASASLSDNIIANIDAPYI